MMCRATFARRWPLATRVSSWVSRIFTSANSAATKNAFNSTKATIMTMFSAMPIRKASKTYFSKYDFQHVLQAYDANFTPFATEHNRQSLAAALHSSERDFETHIFVEEQGRLHV